MIWVKVGVGCGKGWLVVARVRWLWQGFAMSGHQPRLGTLLRAALGGAPPTERQLDGAHLVAGCAAARPTAAPRHLHAHGGGHGDFVTRAALQCRTGNPKNPRNISPSTSLNPPPPGSSSSLPWSRSAPASRPAASSALVLLLQGWRWGGWPACPRRACDAEPTIFMVAGSCCCISMRTGEVIAIFWPGPPCRVQRRV